MAVKLGFTGLGVMGGPMAGHLLRAGHPLTVWNRTPAKVTPLESAGAIVADSAAALASTCEVVFLCVTRTEDVEELMAQMAPAARPGTLFVDHSTIAPAAAVRIAEEVKAQGHGFVDAPVTGGSMGAQAGTLTVFMGGDAADVDRARPFVQAYARRAERVGEAGKGQAMKMANQIAVGGALLGLCETLAFAHKAGLDLALTCDMVGGGAGGSWAFANYGPKILAEDWSPGFSVTNQRKDFGYVREEAQRMGAAIPGTQLVDVLLAQLAAGGRGEDTTAALYEVLLGLGYEP